MSKLFNHDGTTYDPTFEAATRGIFDDEAPVYHKKYQKVITYDEATRIYKEVITTIDEFGRKHVKVIVKEHGLRF